MWTGQQEDKNGAVATRDTLQGVCDKAVAMEAALKDAATMKTNAPESDVYYSGGWDTSNQREGAS